MKLNINLKKFNVIFAAAPFLLNPVLASETPNFSDPTKLVVGYAPGGNSDRAARLLAKQLQEKLGINVIVENKSGAGGRIAAQYTKNQANNQDTLMIGNPAVMVVAPLVYDEIPYSPTADFTPVSLITDYTFGIAVKDDSPWQDVNELLTWARENPDEFNIAVPASGSLPYFFALMLAEQANVPAQPIGYRGSAPAITDLLGGSVPIAIDILAAFKPQHEGGNLRVLASSGAQPSQDFDNLPTFKEAGLSLEASGWNAIFASSSMDEVKVTYLGNAIQSIMSQPEVQKQFKDSDLSPVANNHTDSQRIIDQFTKTWTPVINESGYKAE